MSEKLYKVVCEWNDQPDTVEEDNLTLEQAERVLCRACNGWNDEDGEGPFIMEM